MPDTSLVVQPSHKKVITCKHCNQTLGTLTVTGNLTDFKTQLDTITDECLKHLSSLTSRQKKYHKESLAIPLESLVEACRNLMLLVDMTTLNEEVGITYGMGSILELLEYQLDLEPSDSQQFYEQAIEVFKESITPEDSSKLSDK